MPYITGLGTRLDDCYEGNTSVFNRSANGYYPVRRGETGVKLYGFNLNGASTTVKFNGTSVGTVTAKPSTDTKETRDYVSFTVPAAATSGEIEITVNELVSLNNKNDDSKGYNKEGNGINNNTLTDTRKVYVWGTTQVVSNGTVRYPSFRIGKDENQSVGFIYDQGGATVYKYLSTTGKETNKASLLDTSYSQWFATACAVDTSGNIYGAAQNGDSGGSNGNYTDTINRTTYKYPNYKLYSFANRKDGSNYNNNGGAYSQGGNSTALEWCYVNNTFYPERIQNPKIAIQNTSSTAVNIANVYYDKANSRLVYRYGGSEFKNNTISFSGAMTTRTAGYSSAANSQEIVSGANAGEYVAIGLLTAKDSKNDDINVAVVCYYDVSAHALKFKHNTNPSGTDWSTEITIDSDYAGEYCDLAVDAAGGIHMAYFRAGGKLKYAYLSSYNATKADVCTVDSYLSVGTNISIETSSKTITENGTTRYVPYISYFTDALKLAKVAWPVALGTNEISSNANTFTDGVSSDMFTGSWEVQVLPTNLTTTLLNYTIGVGEKKKDTTNQSVMLGYGTKAGLETALLY